MKIDPETIGVANDFNVLFIIVVLYWDELIAC